MTEACEAEVAEAGPVRSVGQEASGEMSFYLNGKLVLLRNIDPKTLLIDFLRSSQVGFTGTKLSCGEGGCGACTVVLARRDPVSGAVNEGPINACLRPLCSIDGMAITTIEGIGDYHHMNAIQKRIVEHNGSQCGFCTPGFVMSMYALLRTNSSPSNEEVESVFDGNLCRCTGFRPILDAMQSFVGDAVSITAARGGDYPLEALRPARELTIGDGRCTWQRVTSVPEALRLMQRSDGRSLRLVNGNTSSGIYKRPIDPTDVFLDISQIEDLNVLSIDVARRELTIGAGVTYAALLEFLASVLPRLSADGACALRVLRAHILRIAGHQVRNVATVGGNVMLTLTQAGGDDPFPSDLVTVLAVLGAIVSLRRPTAPDDVETYPVLEVPPAAEFRDGCLLTAIRVPLTSAGECVHTYKVARRAQNSHAIVNAGFMIRLDENRSVSCCRFVFGGLRSIAWRARETEDALIGQTWDEVLASHAQILLRAEIDALPIANFSDGISDSYRQSLANNLFYKFLVLVNLPAGSIDTRFADIGDVTDRPVSYGKHGTIAAPYVAGARDAGRLMLERIRIAPANELLPIDWTTPLVNYDLQKSLPTGRPRARPEGVARSLADALLLERTSEVAELAPLPMVKLGAELQATGEARYTQDLSLPKEPLACHFVLSERSFARFSYSGAIPALLDRLRQEFPGVSDYVSFVDIPRPPPANTYDPTDPGIYDPVFANIYVAAIGQPIGLVLADTPRTAHAAALRMRDFIVYDTTGLAAPILTLDDALAKNSFLKDRTSLKSISRPGSDRSWLDNPNLGPEDGAVLVLGTQKTGAQAHFYFETQSVLAVPGEMDRMTIYSSSQNLGSCQAQVANALGIPTAKVEARALRLGGGFGGKEVRAPFFAVAAAVAARKIGRPVRLALDRNSDMRMVGKRHPFRGSFTVSAKADGTIDRIKFDFIANAGSSYDCTLPVTDLVLLSADSAYGVKTFRASRKPCLTNTLTNTAMRSFGVIQCCLIVEEAIEKLAHKLGLSPEAIRERNFYRDATIDDHDVTPYGQALMDCRINQVWSDFKKIVSFDERAARIAEFNRTHRWRKRGISMIPIKYGISYTFTPSNESGADILVYANDGTVLVKHGGVEMGQGIHTKIARLAADALGIDIKYIEVAGSNTFDIANAPSTGASTGTDLSGGAVWAACVQLRERLVAFCKSANPPIPDWETQWQSKWPAIVKAANTARVQLASQALFKSPDLASLDGEGQLKKPKPGEPDPRIFYYFTYSVAASEVEIDVLTGEHSIIRADVVYDSGKTINAGLDYGQIEGGFVQGVGNVTSEELYYSSDGQLLADGTWNYKIPCSKSIPIEFNVYLLDYIPSPDAKTPLDRYGIRSAKSTGEPPLVLASSVFFAIKHAILAAREDAGYPDWFELEAPATVERIQEACLVGANQLVMREQ